MKKLGKKGALDQLGQLAIALVVFLIVVVVGLLITAEAKTQGVAVEGITCNSTAGGHVCNTSDTVLTELGGLSDWLGIIVVAAIGAAVLGLVMLFRRK